MSLLMRVASNCDDLHAGHLHLFVHHAAPSSVGHQSLVEGGGAGQPDRHFRDYLRRDALWPIGKKASPRHKILVDEFIRRLNAILPWDQRAVDATVEVMRKFARAGTPIGPNDSAIAGHAMATASTLVTNNVAEFRRVAGLEFEDWIA